LPDKHTWQLYVNKLNISFNFFLAEIVPVSALSGQAVLNTRNKTIYQSQCNTIFAWKQLLCKVLLAEIFYVIRHGHSLHTIILRIFVSMHNYLTYLPLFISDNYFPMSLSSNLTSSLEPCRFLGRFSHASLLQDLDERVDRNDSQVVSLLWQFFFVSYVLYYIRFGTWRRSVKAIWKMTLMCDLEKTRLLGNFCFVTQLSKPDCWTKHIFTFL
jgi:hypothetical protein